MIVDVPDATSALAVSLAVNASGAFRLSTLPLITPEEVDAACKKAVPYRGIWRLANGPPATTFQAIDSSMSFSRSPRRR